MCRNIFDNGGCWLCCTEQFYSAPLAVITANDANTASDTNEPDVADYSMTNK